MREPSTIIWNLPVKWEGIRKHWKFLKEYQNRGIWTTFFENISCWTEKNGVVGLKLTVECDNEPDIHLYKQSGF